MRTRPTVAMLSLGVATMAIVTLTDAERDHLRGLAKRSDDRRVIHRALALLDLGAG
ncbi:hypothetical protein [Tautonia rosea]|uniref:hypothetical protein n=1 Tax=Tautonia rosea TaxID=2728037 RepID=UPI001473457A|nr:hypothetical protein [Tautonia rosea]